MPPYWTVVELSRVDLRGMPCVCMVMVTSSIFQAVSVTHLVVYHHHPDHVPTGLDPLQHFVHVDIYVN